MASGAFASYSRTSSEDPDVVVGVSGDEDQTSGDDKAQPTAHHITLKTAVLMAVVASVLSACITSAVHQAWDGPSADSNVQALKDKVILAADFSMAEALPAEAIFSELTVDEIRAVARFAAAELGCTTTYVSLSKCFLTGAEAVSLLLPQKHKALAHIDHGAARPRRMAQVMVAHGEKPVAQGVGLYSVGPLDGSGGLAGEAKVTLVRSLHWNYRPLQMDDMSVDPAVTRALEPIHDLLVSTFGPVFPNLRRSYDPSVGTAVYWTGANVFSSLKRRSSRFWFDWYRSPNEFQISWLHTLPFNFDMSHEGPPEDWKAVNISYCGQYFSTIDVLVASEANGKVWHCDGKQRTQYSWDVPGPNPGVPGKFPLPSVSTDPPAHPRSWKVSPRGSIEWGDWKLVATVRPSSGLAIHDARYRKDRILYELSLSDCHAYYAGPRPEKQYHFSDKAYSLAQISGNMVERLDCPAGASFIEGAMWVNFFRNGSSTSDPTDARGFKLGCVFESNGVEGSSWRHTQLINRQVTGRPKKMLVVRAIGTVGNYDYITEVFFGEDGGVTVREAFAGYPEVDTQFEAVKPNWGGIVHEHHDPKRGKLVQNLHSHYCVFKVDLDVLGTENEFYTSKITHSAPHAPNTLGQKIQSIQRINAEDPGMDLVATAQTPGGWRIANSKARNLRSNSSRGYAIVMGSAPSVHTYEASHPFASSATFARRHLAVTQRKETEPSATSVLDFYPVVDPLYSIDKFLSDHDSLVGKDLVCWVSIGKEHAARTEDQPLISNFGVDFSLVPWNYHDENPEMTLAMYGEGPEKLVSSTQLHP